MSKFTNNLNNWQMTLEDTLEHFESYAIDNKDLISYDRTLLKHLLIQLIVMEEEIRNQRDNLIEFEKLSNNS